MVSRYQALGVTHQVENVPLYKPSQRKNLWVLLAFLVLLPLWIRSMIRLGGVVRSRQIDLLHLNHDGFLPVAIWNRWFWKTPVICHMRTMIPVNTFGRRQAQLILKYCDGLICISSRERDRIRQLVGELPARKPRIDVVFNIGGGRDADVETPPPPLPVGWDDKFKVIWLGNISRSKGTDRIPEIARVLKQHGREDIGFVVCGEERGRTRKRSGSYTEILKVAIRDHQLCDMVYLTGFVEEPGPLIDHCQAVIRTSRSNDPWGRDIIEGLIRGKPVFATGSSSPIMSHGTHGYLFPEYSASGVAEAIRVLADDPERYLAMSKNSRDHAMRLFSGGTIAERVADIYLAVAAG